MKSLLILLLFVSSLTLCNTLQAQSVSFALKSSPSANLVFDSFGKYQNGIVIANFINLKIESAGSEWDLYVGTNTAIPGVFDQTTSYGKSGNPAIPVGVLKARITNSSNTSQTGTGFIDLTDIATPTYIIGSPTDDPAISCGSAGTNTPGSYNTTPQCYNFRVDLKAAPGFGFQPGSYSLRIDFILVQDL